MATHALPSSHILGDDEPQAAAAAAAHPTRPSLMRRCYEAFLETQQRRAQREVDRVLGSGAFRRAAQNLPPER
jgi:hypothetical protein